LRGIRGKVGGIVVAEQENVGARIHPVARCSSHRPACR
jgi:hypothetical protein